MYINRDHVCDVAKGLRSRAAECRKLLSEVPEDDDEMNVRQHVRLRAKAVTYEHSAELLEMMLDFGGKTDEVKSLPAKIALGEERLRRIVVHGTGWGPKEGPVDFYRTEDGWQVGNSTCRAAWYGREIPTDPLTAVKDIEANLGLEPGWR